LVAFVDRFFVSVETPEDAIAEIDAIRIHVLERFRGALRVRFESVGDGDEFDVVFRAKTVRDRAATATAAPDESNLNDVVAADVGAARNAHTAQNARSGDEAGRFHKIASFHYYNS
jgi:hypothetical protein